MEKLEDWQGKYIDVIVITADVEKKRLVLSGREVEKERKEEEHKERMAQFKAGDVVEGTVDSIKALRRVHQAGRRRGRTAAHIPDQHPEDQASRALC